MYPMNNWGGIHPVNIQPMFGTFQPVVPIYQTIVTPAPQVIIQKQRSGLEGLVLFGLVYLIGKALVNRGREMRAPTQLSSAVGDDPGISYIPPSQARPAPPRSSYQAPRGDALVGDGMYFVGVDIPAGTYRCEGTPGRDVYWERASDASGERSSLIANFCARGPVYVTVNQGEFFRSERSGGWILVHHNK
jgi:hypothetical protein